MPMFYRNLITEPRVRLKYQQIITNSFVDVSSATRCFVSAITLLLGSLSGQLMCTLSDHG